MDVRKEQDVDPEGLWMILDNGKFIKCDMDYIVFGDFELADENQVFEFVEESIRINLEVHFLDEDAVLIRLQFTPRV